MTPPTSDGPLTPDELGLFRDQHLRTLLDDVLPFWLGHGLDRENSGYYTGLDRTGELIETDKSMWFQGRFAWMLARLYTDLDPRSEWLQAAESGIQFMLNHGFDSDGRMYYRVSAAGTPLVKRRYLFTEAFAITALAAFGEATGKITYIDRARSLLSLVDRYSSTPGLLQPKWLPSGRKVLGLAFPMIMIATLQELRRSDPANADQYTSAVDAHISTIGNRFLDEEHRCLLENVGADGPLFDHNEGRLLNPGHSLEAAWFILREARERNRTDYRALGLKIYNWMWEWGWDSKWGGVFYFRDALNHPSSEYWHDMKFWWPQCEAILASLEAYCADGDDSYASRYRLAHAWAYEHLPDPDHPEWFGYLHRDGTVSSDVKGNMFKGPFHVPRMQLLCSQLLDGMIGER